MTWRFIQEALREYEDAAFYYDDISPRLGDRFVLEFEQTIQTILKHPTACTRGRRDTRRRRMKHFPLFIVYRVKGGLLDIIAIAHERRGDEYWESVHAR